MVINMINNKLLRIIRRHRGLTQTDVADAVGVTQGAYHRWESGQTQPAPDTIAELCDVLNVSHAELVLTLPEVVQEEAMIALMDMKVDVDQSQGDDDYHDKLVRYQDSLLKTIKMFGGLPKQTTVAAQPEPTTADDKPAVSADTDVDDYVKEIVDEQQKKSLGQELLKTDDGKTIFSPPV